MFSSSMPGLPLPVCGTAHPALLLPVDVWAVSSLGVCWRELLWPCMSQANTCTHFCPLNTWESQDVTSIDKPDSSAKPWHQFTLHPGLAKTPEPQIFPDLCYFWLYPQPSSWGCFLSHCGSNLHLLMSMSIEHFFMLNVNFFLIEIHSFFFFLMWTI